MLLDSIFSTLRTFSLNFHHCKHQNKKKNCDFHLPLEYFVRSTQIFITPRKDTITGTMNQIPSTLIKPKHKFNIAVKVPVKVPVQAPVPATIQVSGQVPVRMQMPVQMPVQIPVQMPVQMPAQMPVQVPVQVPVIPHPKVQTPYEMNKLFNEMKNSKKPFMKLTMKAPAKASSMLPDPFNLFDENNRYRENQFVLISPHTPQFKMRKQIHAH